MKERIGEKIGIVTATSIVVANMVGTGIFGSLGFQVAAIPSAFPILLLWLIGGVISFCGALCYAELAGMSPRSGGEYQLLNLAWPRWVGFLAGWISITAGFTAPLALNAVLLGSYLESIIGVRGDAIGALVLVLVCLVHLGPIRRTSWFQTGFTSFKLILLVTLAILCFALGSSQPVNFLPREGDWARIGSPEYGISLVFVLYAYAGWNAATYMMDEVRDPARTVPRALLIGTVLVTALYLAVNAAFLYATPMEALSGRAEAGLIAAEAVLGAGGGGVIGVLIGIGLISTISSMTWAGPRLTSRIGQDFGAFRRVAATNRNGVPAAAILLQTGIALVLVLTTTFEVLIYYIQALLTVSSMAVVAGMVWLRFRGRDLERPFRAWGYPWTPAIFLLGSAGVLVFQVMEKTVECLGGIATLAIGILIYRVASRKEEVGASAQR